MDMTPLTCCVGCGLPATGRGPFTWALTIDASGERRWTCTTCARAALPAIESGVAIPLV